MIREARCSIRMVNDCYYMLKEFSLLGLLFGCMPGFSIVTIANVVNAVPVAEDYLPSPLWIEDKAQNCLEHWILI